MRDEIRFLIIVFLHLFPLVAQSQSCESLPVAISTYDSCIGDTCKISKSVSISLGLKQQKFCFSIFDPVTKNQTERVEISIIGASSSHNLDNCYNTDDPAFDCKFHCGCPGGSSGSCSSCPVSPKYSDLSVCRSGKHRSKHCFWNTLGATDDYCSVCSFSFYPRFRVCKISQPLFDSNQILITRNGKSFAVDYQGVSGYTIPLDENNVVKIQSASVIPLSHDFVVYDYAKPGDFYLLSSSFVNSIGTHDISKVGWYKVGGQNPLYPSLYNETLKSCSLGVMNYKLNYLNVARFLTSNQQFRASRVTPKAELLTKDGTFTPYDDEDLQHHFTDWAYAGEGVLVIANPFDNGGKILGFGVSGELMTNYNPSSWTLNSTVRTCDGIIAPNGLYLCQVFGHQKTMVCHLTGNSSIVFTCNTDGNPNPSYNGCGCVEIKMQLWPNGEDVYIKYVGKKVQRRLGSNSTSVTIDTLFLPLSDSSVLMTYEMSNVALKMNTDIVKYISGECAQKGGSILCDIELSPKTGTCSIYFTPHSALQGTVSDGRNLYKIVSDTDGEVNAIIWCNKEKTLLTFFVSYDNPVTSYIVGEEAPGYGSWLARNSHNFYYLILVFVPVVVYFAYKLIRKVSPRRPAAKSLKRI